MDKMAKAIFENVLKHPRQENYNMHAVRYINRKKLASPRSPIGAIETLRFKTATWDDDPKQIISNE